MSIEAMRAVWAHSETRGNTRMVLTIIANAANREGWDSYQFQSSIAEAANIQEGTVQKCVAKAIELGELEVHRPDRTKQNRYSVMLPGLAIHDDPDERSRRDETYVTLAYGRAAQTQQNRANRRSEDPHVHTGPSADDRDEDPHVGAGGTRTPVRVGPARTSGCDPHERTGLKEETPLNTNETPVKELALAAEEAWGKYPHNRRNLNAPQMLDKLAALGVDDVAGIERVGLAIAEDIQSRDFQEGFAPKLSSYLAERRWDREVADVVSINPLHQVVLSDPDPELERIFRRDVSSDGWDTAISSCWHGRRGGTYVLGNARDITWIEARYRRVLDRIVKQLDYAGLELVLAEPPQAKPKENAA